MSPRPNDMRLRRRIAAALRAVLSRHACPRAVLSVAVVDDATMADLHARYLGIRAPTDVLSFDLSDGPADGAVDGEIVVSEDTAGRESQRRGLAFEEELLRYVIHGALHLLGHSDDTPAGAAAMHRAEDELLASGGPVVVRRATTVRRVRKSCASRDIRVRRRR